MTKTQDEGCAAHGAAGPPGCFPFKSSDILKSFPQVDCFLNATRDAVSGEQTAEEEFSL